MIARMTAPPRSSRKPQSTHAIRVLLADDSVDDVRRVREGLLEQGGFQVYGARDIDEAESMVGHRPFDVAVLGAGYWGSANDFARMVRGKFPDVAIVLLTDGPVDDDADEELSAVAHDFYSKQHLDDPHELSARIRAAVQEVRAVKRRDTMVRWLERESLTDHLTGLNNRRAFDEELKRICSANRSNGVSMTLLLMDVVGTRMVNEAHGREAGDAMIRRAAECVGRAVRGSDFAARTGGDDFGIILTSADLDTGRRVARRVAQDLERTNGGDDAELPVEVNFGVASGVGCSAGELYEAAERQLAECRHGMTAILTFPGADDGGGGGRGPSVA